MNEQTTKLPCGPHLASTEADLFEAVFGFYQKTMALLPQSSLDGGKVKVVAERIKRLMDDATEEAARSRDLNLAERLDSAYEEVRDLVEKLSKDGGGERPKSTEQDSGG